MGLTPARPAGHRGRSSGSSPVSASSRVHASLRPRGPGIGPEGADRRIGNLTRLQLTDRRAVDPGPFGHIREAQTLSLAFAAQARQGLDQFRIPDGRVFLSIGFDVAPQLRSIVESLAVGATGLDGGTLLLPGSAPGGKLDFDAAAPGGRGGASVRLDPDQRLASIDGVHKKSASHRGQRAACWQRDCNCPACRSRPSSKRSMWKNPRPLRSTRAVRAKDPAWEICSRMRPGHWAGPLPSGNRSRTARSGVCGSTSPIPDPPTRSSAGASHDHQHIRFLSTGSASTTR